LNQRKQKTPKKIIKDVRNIADFKYEDFNLEGDDPHPAIKASVAI